MNLTERELDILMNQVLNIGESMYCSGAEISRIEETLWHIGKAYGASHVNVFAITSSILVTLEFSDYPNITSSRRIRKSDTMNLSRLAELNQLSRDISANPIPVEELRSKVLPILKDEPPQAAVLCGQILAAACFAVFFKGSVWDMIAAGLAGAVIFFIKKLLAPLCRSKVFFSFLVSLITGFFVSAECAIIPCLHFDEVMIADIMVLIPGIAITNSLRYTISGDTISGVEKLAQSVISACSIAVGISVAIFVFGRI